MSTVILRRSFYLYLLIASGCTFNKNTDKKTNSLTKYRVENELSYKGNAKRSIPLKFNVNYETNPVQITAEIKIPNHWQSDLVYKWKMGEGVNSNSELSGKIIQSDLKDSNNVEIKIEVTGFNPDKKSHIGFEVNSYNGREAIFADGIISSQKQTSFESIVQEVEAYKKETQ